MATGVSVLGFPGLNLVDTNQFNYGPKGDVAPETALAEQALNRKQQIANLLIQRGLAPMPQGQMVGRFYVPGSPVQGVANLASVLAGALGTHMIDRKHQELAQQDRDMVTQALAGYRDATAPYEVQTKAADNRSVNGSGVSPQLPYGIDPNTMPNTFDIDQLQPNTDAQVQANKNAIALNTPQPQQQEAPLQGTFMNIAGKGPQDMPGTPQPLVDALQGRYDAGEQYTRQPFAQPQSQVTVSGPEYGMQERTPEEKRQALIDLIANPHPRVASLGQLLAKQEQEKAQAAAQREFMGEQRQLDRENRLEVVNGQLNQALMMGLITKDQKDQLLKMQEKQQETTAAHQKEMERLQGRELDIKAQQLSQGKTPPGYRQTKDGNLEAIPGGPADQKIQGQLNADTAAMNTINASLDNLITNAKALRDHPGLEGITGFRGAFPNMPGGDAANAQELLNSLRSKNAVQSIQDMRNMSKTGGAVGQVTEKEWPKLENLVQSMGQAQSTPAMKDALNKLIEFAEGTKTRTADAFNMKHKGAAVVATPQSAPSPSPAGPLSTDEQSELEKLRKKYGR
jgi:hypothetical protein